jgi:hypothetical protein
MLGNNKEAAAGGRYCFGDEVKLTPEEYGYWSFRWSAMQAESFMTDNFRAGMPGHVFPHSAKMMKQPVGAHLYLTAYHAGIHFVFAALHLQVGEVALGNFLPGVRRALLEMKDGVGGPLPILIQDGVARGVAKMAQLVDEQFREDDQAGPEVFRPLPTPPVMELLNSIARAYSDDHKSLPATFFNNPLAFPLFKLIDQVRIGIFEGLAAQKARWELYRG